MFLGGIAGRMSVDHSRVFAFGDTTGDVPMLNAASLKTIAADILGQLGKVVG